MNLLILENVTAFYGPSQALFGVDLCVTEGEVVLRGRKEPLSEAEVQRARQLLPPGWGAVETEGGRQ